MRGRREGIKKGDKKLICFLSDSFDRKLCKTLFGETYDLHLQGRGKWEKEWAFKN